MLRRKLKYYLMKKGICTGIYPDWAIKNLANDGFITPFNEKNVNPASYDLTIGGKYRYPVRPDKIGNECMLPDKWSDEIDIPEEGIYLYPGSIVLLHSEEKTNLPDYVSCSLYCKSTTGRKGLEHLHAGWGECGFNGTWTFEVTNQFTCKRNIKKGDRLFQLVFHGMAGKPDVNYACKADSHYCNQKGPEPNWDNN